MRVKIPLPILYFFTGIFFAILINALCKKPSTPTSQTVTTTKIETLKVFKIKRLPPETVRSERIYRSEDTVFIERPVVIGWKEYTYEDRLLRAKMIADTLKEFSYKIKGIPREAGVLFTPQSVLFYGTPTTHTILGVGWNFRMRETEILVGVRIRL
jgi:hypothetical protein